MAAPELAALIVPCVIFTFVVAMVTARSSAGQRTHRMRLILRFATTITAQVSYWRVDEVIKMGCQNARHMSNSRVNNQYDIVTPSEAIVCQGLSKMSASHTNQFF